MGYVARAFDLSIFPEAICKKFEPTYYVCIVDMEVLYSKVSLIVHVVDDGNEKHETFVCRIIGRFHKSMATKTIALLKFLD